MVSTNVDLESALDAASWKEEREELLSALEEAKDRQGPVVFSTSIILQEPSARMFARIVLQVDSLSHPSTNIAEQMKTSSSRVQATFSL